jgi:hypothetical protein
MRRSIAILLAVVFSWMLVLPMFAVPTGTDAIPACCRKNGKHRCQMMEKATKTSASFAALSEKCPCFPRGTAAGHIEAFRPATRQAIFAGLVAHPAGCPQTAAGYRASYYRAKQKRGPPSFLLS